MCFGSDEIKYLPYAWRDSDAEVYKSEFATIGARREPVAGAMLDDLYRCLVLQLSSKGRWTYEVAAQNGGSGARCHPGGGGQ